IARRPDGEGPHDCNGQPLVKRTRSFHLRVPLRTAPDRDDKLGLASVFVFIRSLISPIFICLLTALHMSEIVRSATVTPVSAYISTPGCAVVRAVQVTSTEVWLLVSSTSTWLSPSVW